PTGAPPSPAPMVAVCCAPQAVSASNTVKKCDHRIELDRILALLLPRWPLTRVAMTFDARSLAHIMPGPILHASQLASWCRRRNRSRLKRRSESWEFCRRGVRGRFDLCNCVCNGLLSDSRSTL